MMHLSNPDTVTDDLLTMVDKLTMPHQSSFTVDELTMIVTHDPLLHQLRAAVRSTTGAHAVGGGLASERNVIDSEALEQYEKAKLQIVCLYQEVTDARPFPDPVVNLRQWYIVFANLARSGKVSRDVVQKKYRILYKLASSIEGRLNPPTTLEITSPCPRCGVSHGADDKGAYRHAVIVESRIEVYRSLEHTRATCVVCKATWVHGQGMRQLRYEIDVAEGTRPDDGEGVDQMFSNSDTVVGAGVHPSHFQGLGHR
jgi:hypothetical protein